MILLIYYGVVDDNLVLMLSPDRIGRFPLAEHNIRLPPHENTCTHLYTLVLLVLLTYLSLSSLSLLSNIYLYYFKMWYPCGSFKGDEKSAALCQSYASNGLLASVSKNQLDAGVGSSLYRDLARLEETIVRGYPQLRKEKGKLEYGYKLSYPGLSKEQSAVHVVEVKEAKGFLDGIKNVFSGGN